MNVYQTDHEGFYVNATIADVDPMDDTNYLIPAGCVTDAPPTLTEGQRAKWADGSWSKIVDTLTLEPVKVARKGCRLLLAAWVGSVRLIDNALL